MNLLRLLNRRPPFVPAPENRPADCPDIPDYAELRPFAMIGAACRDFAACGCTPDNVQAAYRVLIKTPYRMLFANCVRLSRLVRGEA